ncbi:MAG: hypothetical protein JO040_01785 [Gemmatimonadetes bacterium]|nr:hypothetical protein [Gemmatimonadota bacterium]
MRTVTAAQSTVLSGTTYRVSARVWVKDAWGVFQNLSALAGRDWLSEVSWDDDVDQSVSQCTVQLWRESYAQSLSPMKKSSPLNQNAQGVFGPLLDMGREMKLEVATTAVGVDPAATDWQLVFHGDVDEVDWGRGESRVTLVARDLGARLLDRYIETERAYPAADQARDANGAVAVEAVMQRILDDNLGAGAVTLWVPASPGWMIKDFKQEKDSVLEALRKLAQQFGWDLRYRWDAGTSSFRLKLFAPQRTRVVNVPTDPANTAPDWTFGPSRYLDVSTLRLARAGIRNYIRVQYLDRSTTPSQLRTSDAYDPDSMAKYGRRFMELQEDTEKSAIDTPAEAAQLAQSVLSDLADPRAEQEVEMHFFWPAELGDYYLFQANGVHYDQDQVGAVVAVKHQITREQQRTTINTRGRAAGAYRDWLRREIRVAGTQDDPEVGYRVEVLENAAGTTGTLRLTLTDPGALVQSVGFYVAAGPAARTGPSPADRTPSAGVYEKDVTLHEQHTSIIEPVITLKSGRVIQPGAETFDQGATPVVLSLSGEVNDAGAVVATARGDSDTQSFRIALRKDRMPTTAEVRAAAVYPGGGTAAREVVTTLPGTLAPGEIAYLGALAYADTGGLTLESVLATTQTKRSDRVPPSLSPRSVLNTARDAADLYVVLESLTAEQVRLHVKDEATGTTWSLVTGQTDTTPLFVASGTEIGINHWFYSGTGSTAKKLAAFPLVRDQVTRVLFQAEGKNLGAKSTWVPLTLNVKEQPWLESVDVVWDEGTDTLTMRGIGGAFTRSARIEFADNEGFTGTTLSGSSVAASDGGSFYATRTLAAAERGKTWHARITPFNGALVSGATSGTGGVPQRDSVQVPASESGGIERPTAAIVYVSETISAFTLEYQGTLGAGGTGPLQYRTRTNTEGTNGTWSAWTALPTPFPQQVVTRLGRLNRVVTLQVQDAAGRTATDTFLVPARFGGVDPTDGGVIFDQPYSGRPSTDTPAYGHEGRRRVDTVYDTDGGIGYNVTIRDPDLGAGQYRSIRDTAKRAQTGLAAVDAAGNGGEIARNAPLARLAPVLLDISSTTGRIATVGGARAEQIPSGLSGAQLSPNPDFLNGLTGYYVYNNSGGTHVQLFHETDVTAPNTSGKRMRVGVSGTNTSPGNGGFTLSLLPTDGAVAPGYYRRGAEIVFTIRAWIPSGLTILFASNAVGNEAVQTWLSSQTGTSAWATYTFRLKVGTTGTFNTTGFFWVSGGTPPFEWYVAMVDAIDVSAQSTVFAGSNLRASSGVRLGDADIVTSQGTAADTSSVGGRAAGTVRDEAMEGNRKSNYVMPYGDGLLRENLQVNDPGVTWRNLTDVGRRSQAGLTYANLDGTGGEIAKVAPLARLSPVLPAIHASTGLLNRAIATHDGGRIASEQAVTDFGNLIYNPSFEVDANGDGVGDGWTPHFEGGGGAYSLVQGIHGSYAQSQTPSDGVSCAPFRIRAGERYRFGVTVGNPSGTEQNGFYFRVLWYGDTNDFSRGGAMQFTDLVTGDQAVLNISGWTDFSGVLEAPSGARFCRVTFYTWSPRTVVLYFDRAYAQSEDAFEGRRHVETLSDSDRLLKSGVLQYDGAREVKLAQFAQAGVVQDGTTISFNPPFQSVPAVMFGPGQVTYDPALGSVRQRTVAEAVGLTPSGFTARIKVRQADPVLTTNTLSPSSGICTKNSATEAYDDVYVFNYSVSINSYTTSSGTTLREPI